MRSSWRDLWNAIVKTLLLFGSISLEASENDIAPAQPPINWDDGQFYYILFGYPYTSQEKARTHIETKLKMQLDELNRVCGLSDIQIQKLKLAASLDVTRYFDEVEVTRKTMQQREILAIARGDNLRETWPLRIKRLCLFGETSFFSKTVRKTLNQDQLAKYDSVVNERRQFRYRASIKVALTRLELCTSRPPGFAPLRATQREAIVQLILENTQPPLAFGDDVCMGSIPEYAVMYYLSKLPESKLKPLMEERQWEQMQGTIKKAQIWIQDLIESGLLPRDGITS